MSEDTVPIHELTTDSENVRQRNERATETLEHSLREFGAARSVVMDADGIIRAGNGTLSAAAAAGITKARIVESDRDELVVVKRNDLRGDQAKAYAIADNRTAELAEWDDPALIAQLDELAKADYDLEGLIGFGAEELKQLEFAVHGPEFEPVDEGSQQRLDEIKKTECPNCGHEFEK